jgi:hypothetical protein
MTIGDFLTIYQRNHVAFLKNSLGTSRRLQKYVGRLGHVELADLKRMEVIEWFHAIAKSDGPQGANLALQQLHAVYVKAGDWEIYEGKNPAARIKKFPKHLGVPSRDWHTHAAIHAFLCPVEEQTAVQYRPQSTLQPQKPTIP